MKEKIKWWLADNMEIIIIAIFALVVIVLVVIAIKIDSTMNENVFWSIVWKTTNVLP